MGQDKTYTLTYHRLVPGDITRLDTFWHAEILASIESKLLVSPDLYGKPLRRSLKGCRGLRVGDYRVVFQIQPRVVHIVAIVHRSGKYKGVEKRI